MKTSKLVFVGIKGSVIALNRATGAQEWATHLKGADFVNVLLQGDMVLATCRGEVFCVDPLTGIVMWHNPLKGLGMGLATIATDQGQGDNVLPIVAEKRRRDEQAASA